MKEKSPVERLEQLLKDTIELEKNIEKYRDESTDAAFKKYLDALHYSQSQPDQPSNTDNTEKLSKLCQNSTDPSIDICDEEMSLEAIEAAIENDIDQLKQKAKETADDIFKYTGNKCWQDNLHQKSKPDCYTCP